ncbi:restriction endonuclease subunit S [Idiomarina sp.]|uniref:restriction endonuclease subunit S n=1 Tax=Idiomarina sp. TaxID=1874361 RepID=UPI0025BF25A3|nr:restriction endonuclease subunit S [Idiomarina sp.]
MSDFSFMERLLDGVEVEFIKLNDLVSLQRGKRLVKSELNELGEYAVFQNSMTPLGYYHASNVSADTTFIICAGAAGEIGYSNNDFWAADDVFSLKVPTHINSKYLYHGLLAQKGKILSQVRRASIPRLSRSAVENLVVPIPCPENPEKSLQIQAEIVRILDAFTSLTAELTAELTARKKQYNYYRDKLLSFEDGDVEWKTLGEVSLKSYSGGTPKAGNPTYYDGGTIPWLRTKEVKFSDIYETSVKVTQAAIDETAAKWIPENCVIIAISGATAGRSAINRIPLTTNQHCCCLEIDPKQALYRYVFHWVSLNYEKLKEMGQGARGDLNSGIIKSFKIPIPCPGEPTKSLEEQERIVTILDKFDALTNSITEGLPREIELRQKQYEYYRDLLLSFPKPDEQVA